MLVPQMVCDLHRLIELLISSFECNNALIFPEHGIETAKNYCTGCSQLQFHYFIIITGIILPINLLKASISQNLCTCFLLNQQLSQSFIYVCMANKQMSVCWQSQYKNVLDYKNIIKQILFTQLILDNHMEPQHKTEEKMQEQAKNFGRFSIFLIAKNAQNSYGVKTGDYMRYRRYCTRKIEKLRKAMQYKYGNRKHFVKKDIAVDKQNDKRVLQVAIFSCERYWAYANQCKFNQSIKQSNKLRAKFMAVKKFRKAHIWSQKLVNICQGRTDHITVSEAQAYSYYLEGLYYLEKQDWKVAQAKLIACRQIISDLLRSIDTMNAKVYRQKIDQIDQTIKFCNFKISKGQQIPIQEIIQMRKNGQESLANLIGTFAQRRLKQMSLDSGNQIKFGAERYPIKDEKIIQQKSKIDLQLQNLQIIKKKALKQTADDQLFEQLLNFFSSTIILIDETIKMVGVHSQKVKQYTQGQIAIYKKVGLLFEQIKYTVLIDRNNVIFKHSYALGDKDIKKSAPQTLAKLLSNSITIYSQYVDLQKLKSQGSQGVDPEKVRAVDAKIFYYRTLRLFFVGQVYFNNDKIKQAYSLWQQCQRCLQSVKNSQQQTIKAELDLVPLNEITDQLKTCKIKCIIKNYKTNEINKDNLTKQMQQMSVHDKRNKQQTQFTLYDLMTGKVNVQSSKFSLTDFSQLEPIDLPGRMLPIPTRPIFYDIFQSQIQYPTLENKVQKGWFGKLFRKGP